MLPWQSKIARTFAAVATVWALMEPLGRPTAVARAEDPRYFPETGFWVAPGAFHEYFRIRGGEFTFGPPISNRFTLLGHDVQLFRYHALKQNADGSISTMSLLDSGAVPSPRIGGRVLPAVDPQLVSGAPSPTAPDYHARAQAFIQANAPDHWEGLTVGFYAAFLETVTAEDAFPAGGGDPRLLPLLAHEVWGLPVSRPARDPGNPDLVHLRWERGVMEYDRRDGLVLSAPLGEVFKAVLTGEGLPPDLAADARGSPFFRQLDSRAPGGVARPAELPQTSLLTAFLPTAETPGGAPASPAAPAPGHPAPPMPVPGPPAGPSANLAGPATPAGGPAPVAAPPSPSASPGPDVCSGDERITFSPQNPRVGTDLLIVVTSSRPHPYGRLVGTERADFVRERPGQLGLVWEWVVNLTYAGQHEYVFYVDSTIPCTKLNVRVGQALGSSTGTSRP